MTNEEIELEGLGNSGGPQVRSDLLNGQDRQSGQNEQDGQDGQSERGKQSYDSGQDGQREEGYRELWADHLAEWGPYDDY